MQNHENWIKIVIDSMAPSRCVFATVKRIFRWNHFSGGRGLAAEHDGWSPRNDPQKGSEGILSHSRPQPQPNRYPLLLEGHLIQV